MFEDFRLRVFSTLVSEKSFTKAATLLCISQPAVSQHISELEKNLGFKLFDRLRGEVVLTPEGAVFKESADGILEKYSEMEDFFMHFPPTVVKVGTSGEIFGYLTEVLLANFIIVHPEVRFEHTILEDEADLKINMVPMPERRGMLALSYHPSSDLASTRLYRVLSGLLIQ